MTTVTLKDGRDLTIDLYKVTIGEWRSIFKPKQPQSEEDKIIGKIVGLSGKELRKLSQPDYRVVLQAILKIGAGPLEDPNSQSASTEPSQDSEAPQTSTGDGS